MLARDALEDAVTPLAASSSDPAEYKGLARRLQKSKWEPQRTKKTLQLNTSRHPPWWPRLLADAEALLPGYGASAIEAVVFAPLRSYEHKKNGNTRTITNLAAVKSDELPESLLIATLEVKVKNGHPASDGDIRLQSFPLDEPKATTDALAELGAQLNPDSMYYAPDGRRLDAVLLGSLPEKELAMLKNDLWARGIQLQSNLVNAGRREEIKAKVHRFRGDFLIVAINHWDATAETLDADIETMQAGAGSDQESVAVIKLTEGDLAEWWREELDDVLPLSTVADTPTPPTEKKRWEDVYATVRAAHKALKEPKCVWVRDAAWQQLLKSKFLYPVWMEQQTLALFDAAASWRKAGGQVGDFTLWAYKNHGLVVAMKDDGLKSHNNSAIKGNCDGETYVAEPHVKLQRGLWVPKKECGRIYFALDSERKRFLIHHIGLKLFS